jgi:tRNA pseudouridine38-40 synthase
VISYDGTQFCGWARQPGLRSVQGELESALAAVLRVPQGTPVRAACAGRTDAGVHAAAQVVHVDVPMGCVSGAALAGGLITWLNGRLPPDLRVRNVSLAPEGFDARWSAAWRRYLYRVADPITGYDPLARGFTLWHRRVLDVAAMNVAAGPFLGEHDFSAFCKRREGASTVRTIHALSWERTDPVITMTVTSDAFCHSMVRSLVGAFLAVGDGRWAASRPGEMLAMEARLPGAASAPALGLCLAEVGYPDVDALAAQAARAKRWRGR